MPLCHLSATLLGRMQEAAREAYPLEVCGLLIGRRDAEAMTIEQLVMSPNMAEGDRRRRFLIDPTLHFQTLRELRGTARDIVGVFHSHPNGEPYPSAADAEMALEAGLTWIIVSVGADKRTRARAHIALGEAAGFSSLQLAIEP